MKNSSAHPHNWRWAMWLLTTLLLIGLIFASITASQGQDYGSSYGNPYGSQGASQYPPGATPAPVPEPFRPNANGGYPGSDIPPREYNPDENRFSIDKTAPMRPLDGGRYSGQPNPYCMNGPLCGGSSR